MGRIEEAQVLHEGLKRHPFNPSASTSSASLLTLSAPFRSYPFNLYPTSPLHSPLPFSSTPCTISKSPRCQLSSVSASSPWWSFFGQASCTVQWHCCILHETPLSAFGWMPLADQSKSLSFIVDRGLPSDH